MNKTRPQACILYTGCGALLGHCPVWLIPCASSAERPGAGAQLQYPGSLPTMMTDLRHIRVFGAFLSKTEIKFDLVSAVDELAGQVRSLPVVQPSSPGS